MLERVSVVDTVGEVFVMETREYLCMCQRWGGCMHASPRRSEEEPSLKPRVPMHHFVVSYSHRIKYISKHSK